MTKNNHMYMSSEVGVTDLENHEVIQKVEGVILVQDICCFHLCQTFS